MDISCAFPPTVDTPDLVAYAEELGYRRAWIYDTPALQLDVWMTLALAAQRTSRIGLGPGVLIPNLRHVLVTASAIAQMEHLAPGRTAYAFGSGFTGRRALGQKPLKWADVAAYVTSLRALLRGEAVEVDGAMVAMLHADGQAPARPLSPPILIATGGPKGVAVACDLGDGVMASSPVAGFDWSVQLMFGTVIGDDEDLDSERVLRSAGPGAAVAYHGIYERNPDALDRLPGAAAWRDSIEAVDPSLRHLEVHRGHLTELNAHDRLALTGTLAAAISRSGTASQIRERLAASAAAGATEIAFQPAGDDLRAELRTFIEAAQG